MKISTNIVKTGRADLVTSIQKYLICCELESFHVGALSILVYADDILLVAPSVTALQFLLTCCENELHLARTLTQSQNASVPTRV